MSNWYWKMDKPPPRYLYFAQPRDEDPEETFRTVKIGITENPRRRMTDLGLDAAILGIGEYREIAKLERELHEHYRRLRLNGEWFVLQDDLAEDFDWMLLNAKDWPWSIGRRVH